MSPEPTPPTPLTTPGAPLPDPRGLLPRVDFYVLSGKEPRERLKLACRLAEKGYLAQQRVLVWLADAAELASFDDLLWTFADRSFVPHEPYGAAQQWHETPVLLSYRAAPDGRFDLLLNLASEVPAAAWQATRIIEVIDSDPTRLQSGRARFRHYRERGIDPKTHQLAADDAS